MANLRMVTTYPPAIYLGTGAVSKVMDATTQVWPVGGYYNCGYGCQYYSTVQACSTCNPATNSAPTVQSITFPNYNDLPLGRTTTTIQVYSNVPSSGSTALSARGICYSTTVNPNTGNSSVQNWPNVVGEYGYYVTGLTTGTGYYMSSFATNSIGTTYMSYYPTKVFTT